MFELHVFTAGCFCELHKLVYAVLNTFILFLCFRMKEVEVGGVKVLLLREYGVYHATGAKCSHYGAPLVNGMSCHITSVLLLFMPLLLEF